MKWSNISESLDMFHLPRLCGNEPKKRGRTERYQEYRLKQSEKKKLKRLLRMKRRGTGLLQDSGKSVAERFRMIEETRYKNAIEAQIRGLRPKPGGVKRLTADEYLRLKAMGK